MEDWRNYIESNPEILFGKPIVKNTKIPVDLLLDKMSKGETMDDLLEAYPRIDKEAIFAILAFAAESIKNQKVHSIVS